MAKTNHFGIELECSETFAAATLELIEAVTNGCGDGWRDGIIPDTMWGLDVKPACRIHDWDYTEGLTESDRLAADNRLLLNLLTIVRMRSSNHFSAWFRGWRAQTYYQAVRVGGAEPFRKAKENRRA